MQNITDVSYLVYRKRSYFNIIIDSMAKVKTYYIMESSIYYRVTGLEIL